MSTYYVGFLYRGPKWTPERAPEIEKLQEAHLDNIRRLAGPGALILAGPFSDGEDLYGMFVVRLESMEEVRRLCETDPAVKEGLLKIELHPWQVASDIRVGEPRGGTGNR